MTIDGVPAAEGCVAAGGRGGTYTIRVGACRFGQPPMNSARLHPKNGKALSFTSLEILSFISGGRRYSPAPKARKRLSEVLWR
jgi:hypothetical protein